jgi:hypothetical protein
MKRHWIKFENWGIIFNKLKRGSCKKYEINFARLLLNLKNFTVPSVFQNVGDENVENNKKSIYFVSVLNLFA